MDLPLRQGVDRAGRVLARLALFAAVSTVSSTTLFAWPARAVDVPALATLQTAEGRFVARIVDQAMADEIEGIIAGSLPSKGIIGDWVTGNGGYNTDPTAGPWSWHLDEASIDLTQFALEVCDGIPSAIEDRVNSGGTFRRYCPWTGVFIELRADDALPADVDVDGSVGASDAALVETCLNAPGDACWDAADGCCAADVTGDETVSCSDADAVVDAWTEVGPPSMPAACAAAVVPSASAPLQWLLIAALGACSTAFAAHGFARSSDASIE